MKQFVSRWGCLFIGMSSVAFGIAMTTRAGLGTTPLSSSPYTVTFFTPLTLGAASIGLNVFFFALLWAVMGKRFQFTRNLLQVPIVLLFGFLIDFFMWALPQGLMPRRSPRIFSGTPSSRWALSSRARAAR